MSTHDRTTADTREPRRQHAARRRLAGAALTAALVLSACSDGGGDSDDGQKTEPPAAQPQWSDWVELPSAVTPLHTAPDKVLVQRHDNQRLQVLDSAGQEKWTVPEVAMVETYQALASADDERIYVQLAEFGRPLVALSWEDGSELWRVKTEDIHKCSIGEHFQLRPPPPGMQHSDSAPLLLAYGSEDVFSGEPETDREMPESCFDGPTASFPDIPTLIGVNRANGRAAWTPVEDGLNSVVGWSNYDVTGRWFDRIVSSRGAPALVRTEAATGKTASAALGLAPHGYELGDSIFFSDMGNERFYVEPSMSDPVIVDVERWRADDEDPDAASIDVEPIAHGRTCERNIHRSSTGYGFCLQTPDSTGEPGFTGRLMVGPDGQMITQQDDSGSIPAGTYWSAPTTYEPSEGFGSEGEGYLGLDPVVPREGQSPVIALPGENDAIQALDLLTGEEVWSYSSDQANGPGYSAAYVPGVDEVVFAHGSWIVGVSAQDGTEKWTADLSDVDGGAIFHAGTAIAVKHGNGDAGRLRMVVTE